MRKIGLMLCIVFLVSATAGMAMAEYGDPVFDNPIYATQAGASDYYVTDQTIKLWGDDGSGNPVEVDIQDNVAVTVIQGADQNWGGTANIMPGLVSYDNLLGTPDYAAAGWGGAASGGSLVLAFDEDIIDGDGIDFMVHGFGFCFNKAFSAERGTVRIYAATTAYAPTVSAADDDGPGPLGEVTITGDENQWVLLSEWKGWGDWDGDPDTPDTWEGNPDHNYGSAPGAYGEYLWGDLADGGLSSARYIKFELGDGGHYIDPYSGENNNGRAFFVDAVEGRGYEAPANRAPVLEPIGNKEVDEEAELRFALQAGDPEGDSLRFSFTSDLSMTGAALDVVSGVFSWTPADGDAGIYTVTFTVSDDGTPSASDEETIEISVGSVNHPPVFVANAPASTYAAMEGQTIEFEVSATDPDGDDVSIMAADLPGGARFSGGSFSWTTDSGDSGSYTVTFTAVDDGSPVASATKSVTLTVGDVSHHAGPDQVVTEQTAVTLGVLEACEEQSDDTYQWEQTSGPEATLSDVAAANPNFIAPGVEAGEMVLTFRALLNGDSTDDVTIKVRDNAIQLTEAEARRLENAQLVFDNPIGAGIGNLKHCHMGISGEQGELTFYNVLDPADVTAGDAAPENLIYGLFEFKLVLSPGARTAVWSVFLPEPAPETFRWYKYNPTTGEWIDFDRERMSGGTGDGAVFNEDRTRVTLYVTDGGAHDDDGMINLRVSDPSGLGTPPVNDGDTDDDNGAVIEDGGGGGCFIGSLVK